MPTATPKRYIVEPESHPVLLRLRSFGALTAEATAAILRLEDAYGHGAGAELVSDRERTPRFRFVVSGWAGQVRWLPDGRRQITRLILPGDPVGLPRSPFPLPAMAVTALTPVVTVDAIAFLETIRGDRPGATELADRLGALAELEHLRLIDQVVRLGRQTAYERLAGLLLEIRDRLRVVGLATERELPLPLTQEMLADITGLSIVHLNRVLQQLRREALIELSGGVVGLLNPEQLEELADYQPIHRAGSPDAIL